MKTNHQRGFKAKKHSDKGGQSWGLNLPAGLGRIGAGISWDFANGNRGMAKAVRGAKKFVRSRLRASEREHIKEQMKD